MASTLIKLTKPPRMPVGPEDYDRRYMDQFGDILRLYFNNLDNAVGSVVGRTGGQYLQFPYAAISRTTNLTFTANTPTQVTFNQNDFLQACTNTGLDGIGITVPGIYNYQFSIQFANTDSQAHNVWAWLRVNNVDVAWTASKWDVPSTHGGSDGYLIATCNFYVSLQAGDTVELWTAVNSATTYIEAYPAQVSPFAMPGIPSVVATLTFVSNPSP